jgi:hypothetical protein
VPYLELPPAYDARESRGEDTSEGLRGGGNVNFSASVSAEGIAGRAVSVVRAPCAIEAQDGARIGNYLEGRVGVERHRYAAQQTAAGDEGGRLVKL